MDIEGFLSEEKNDNRKLSPSAVKPLNISK